MMTDLHMRFLKKKLFINLTYRTKTKLIMLTKKAATIVVGFFI